MRIGIPTEIKPREGRVALIPAACGELVQAGHTVFVQSGAGIPSGFSDEAYRALGVNIAENAETLYGKAELIVKVKEPVQGDLQWLDKSHLLFCFLHLAPNPPLIQKLCDIGLTAIAFETVEENGRLPLLAPMSEIAGRIAVQVGTHLLHASVGGKGILLGGVAGTERGHVVVLGAGVSGMRAAETAASLGARVTVYDKYAEPLHRVCALSPLITGKFSYHDAIAEDVKRADLVVGAVLIPGARAPKLVSEAMVKSMQPGSVIVDIAIDQGGCVETMHATNYVDPTFVLHEVIHMGVTNMPGAVPRTSSQALCGAILPYVQVLASKKWEQDPALFKGVNLRYGKVVHPALKN
jgi:alanine dehydrogenase